MNSLANTLTLGLDESLQTHAVATVATWQTAVLGALLALMILALALEEKIHARKSIITGVFAVVALLLGTWFGCLPFDRLFIHLGGVDAHLPVYIPAIEWEVIAIISDHQSS